MCPRLIFGKRLTIFSDNRDSGRNENLARGPYFVSAVKIRTRVHSELQDSLTVQILYFGASQGHVWVFFGFSVFRPL